MLLSDAIKRAAIVDETVAMHAPIVDAAKRFYERFGFVPLIDDPMRLFLPFGTFLRSGPAPGTGPES